MNAPILITSFQPWRVHQRSNSSDDLVAAMQKRGLMPSETVWLRHLPVSFELAPVRVMSEMMRLRPRAVVCCGMAEKRRQLSIERQAKRYLRRQNTPQQTDCNRNSTLEQISVLQTTVDIDRLAAGTLFCEISEDAGSYVCNHLYYSVLDFVDRVDWQTVCVFIHIPVLSPENRTLILQDFLKIMNRLDTRNF